MSTMSTKTTAARAGIQAIDVGMQVLQVFRGRHRALPLHEIAVAVGASPSLMHRYLVSLCRAKMVEQEPGSGNYRLGPLALHLGLQRLAAMDPLGVVEPLLRDLVALVDTTSTLAVWGDGGPIVIRWEESSHLIGVKLRIGAALPLLTTATGQVFAAWRPAAGIEPLLAAEAAAARRTGLGPGKLAEVRALLDGVRRQGYARVDGSTSPAICGVSAPIFDHAGALVLALSSLGHQGQIDTGPDSALVKALCATAAEASQRLGFDPPPQAHRRT